jgi:hypothetical protein
MRGEEVTHAWAQDLRLEVYTLSPCPTLSQIYGHPCVQVKPMGRKLRVREHMERPSLLQGEVETAGRRGVLTWFHTGSRQSWMTFVAADLEHSDTTQ